jgi:hypothetical protein
MLKMTFRHNIHIPPKRAHLPPLPVMKKSILILTPALVLSLGLAVSAKDIAVEPLPASSAVAPGKFEATWESFTNNYECPEWFRDAKPGIWAHWPAQCVPEQGDWYARSMYIQGSRQYDFHVENYGHPPEAGFMEIDNLWKAGKRDPEALMQLYKETGARYFVAMANHEDNFDAYDSKYHAWNSLNAGPKKDIVGTWARVARPRHAFWRVKSLVARMALVSTRIWLRCGRSEGRGSLRRPPADQDRWKGQVVGRRPHGQGASRGKTKRHGARLGAQRERPHPVASVQVHFEKTIVSQTTKPTAYRIKQRPAADVNKREYFIIKTKRTNKFNREGREEREEDFYHPLPPSYPLRPSRL